MNEHGCEGVQRRTRSLLAGKQVLLVDNEVFQVAALRDLLLDSGIVATIVTSGVAALAKVEIAPPDAVVLDAGMPGCHGVELLGRLRTRVPNLPVIIATGYEPGHSLVRAMLETGNTAYIAKPIDVRRLVELLLQSLASQTTSDSHVCGRPPHDEGAEVT